MAVVVTYDQRRARIWLLHGRRRVGNDGPVDYLPIQAAVKHHDAATIDRIQHPDMVLVLGDGRVVTKADHLQAAREKKIRYEIQDEEPGTQTVRVLGDTAVVTALLRLKGTGEGQPFDRRVWFSDTYVRTPEGWKYFFGQASLKLPDAAAPKP